MRMETGGSLEDYMAAADGTAAELLASDEPLVTVLRQYDAYFREGLWKGQQTSPIPLMLYTNAFQLFLAGARMALSGHCVAVFPLLRTALEYAAYGSLMINKPELEEVWIHRHQGEAERKACRQAFTFEKAIAPLAARLPDIHGLARLCYDSAIDFGAHPNIRGVFSHVSIDEDREDGMVAMRHTSLYGPSHVETSRGLCACLDFGLAIIGIIALSTLDIDAEKVADVIALSEAKNRATDFYISSS